MSVSLNLAQFVATQAKIAKINERAAKRGLSGHLEVVEHERGMRKVCDHHAQAPCEAFGEFGHHHEEYVTVSIEGEAPKHNGWTFAARVDRLGDASYTLATAPGVEYVSREGIVLGHCDHCSTNRARKTTYVLRNEQGEQVQVGSTCIKDFLGWEGNIAWLDAPAEIDDEWLGGGSFYAAPQFKVDTVLQVAIASVRDRGFVSTQVYSQQSTRSHVALVFDSRLTRKEEIEEQARLVALSHEVSRDDVQALRSFLLSDDFAGQSSYVENLKAIAAEEFIGSAQFGLLASAPQAYAKHLGTVAERAAKKASEWLGAEGQKVTTTITVEKIINTGSYSYAGPDTYLIIGRTEDGEIVKTFTTAGWSREVEVGHTVTLTATVKKHETYEGTKQTSITRAKKVA